jgi:hypothetical protein
MSVTYFGGGLTLGVYPTHNAHAISSEVLSKEEESFPFLPFDGCLITQHGNPSNFGYHILRPIILCKIE